MSKIIFICFLPFFFGISHAQTINKCLDENGKYIYQDKKCNKGGEEIKIYKTEFGDESRTYSHLDSSSYGYSSSSRGSGVKEVYTGPRADEHIKPISNGSGVKEVYTGPRGGRYTITSGGNKSYLPRK